MSQSGDIVAGIANDVDVVKKRRCEITPFLVDEQPLVAFIVTESSAPITPPSRKGASCFVVADSYEAEVVRSAL